MLNKFFLLGYGITIIIAAFCMHFKPNKKNLLVLGILSVILINTIFLEFESFFNISGALTSNIYVTVHFVLWFLVLLNHNTFVKPIVVSLAIVLFLVLSLFNFSFGEGIKQFNHYNFVIGTFIYIPLFLAESFIHLKKERTDYFSSNEFTLLMAPIIYFMGFSLLFSFRSKKISEEIIFANIDLFSLLTTTINCIYLILITLYMHSEFKKGKTSTKLTPPM
ncbi:hypothetical protein [Neptunitalea chrysea]|uniref:hypothetical protein n=1 Tax=Neptunitalea chrysea TaxID=1647581 RepID=UPI002492AD80|nr:hypothetical protein [Neptunitalea chrysea]